MYPLEFQGGWVELAQTETEEDTDRFEWFLDQVQQSQIVLQNLQPAPSWAFEGHIVAYKWQQAIECVTKYGIHWNVALNSTHAQRLAAAFTLLQDRLQHDDNWQEKGISFYMPGLHPDDERSDKVVDLRKLSSPYVRGEGRYIPEALPAAEVMSDTEFF